MRTGRRGFETSRAPLLASLSLAGRAGTIVSSGNTDLVVGDVFTADYSSSLGNWDGYLGSGLADTYRTQGRVAGGGPKGLDAFRINQLNEPNAGTDVGRYTGRYKNLSAFAAGTSRFYRWYAIQYSGNNWRAGNGGGLIRNKVLGVGSDGGVDARMILNINGERNAGYYVEAGHDGYFGTPENPGRPKYPAEGQGVLTGTSFFALQVEVRNGGAGYVKVWKDNDNYASPTFQSVPGNFPMSTGGGYTRLGFYINQGIDPDGVHNFGDAAFRVSTSFDAGWYNWMVT